MVITDMIVKCRFVTTIYEIVKVQIYDWSVSSGLCPGFVSWRVLVLVVWLIGSGCTFLMTL